MNTVASGKTELTRDVFYCISILYNYLPRFIKLIIPSGGGGLQYSFSTLVQGMLVQAPASTILHPSIIMAPVFFINCGGNKELTYLLSIELNYIFLESFRS